MLQLHLGIKLNGKSDITCVEKNIKLMLQDGGLSLELAGFVTKKKGYLLKLFKSTLYSQGLNMSNLLLVRCYSLILLQIELEQCERLQVDEME